MKAKFLIYAAILTQALLMSPLARAVVHSVDADLKVVNWTPDNVLEINVVTIDSDANNYAILAYNWYPNWREIQAEYDSLQKKYSGYKILRANIEKIDSLNLVISAANLNTSLYLLPNQNGFFAHNNLILTKAQYEAVIKAQKADPNGYAKLEGTAHSHMAASELAESYTLTAAQCQVWLGNGTLKDVEQNLMQFSALSEKNGTIKFAETRNLLMQAIQSNCYELRASASSVESFADLMNLRLEVKLNQSTQIRYAISKEQPVSFQVPSLLRPWSNE